MARCTRSALKFGFHCPIRLVKITLMGLGFLVAGTPAVAQENDQFDTLLQGGRVLDGTGNPWFRADVGLKNGLIVAIGDLASAGADRVVEVEGRYVVPGFIDLHSHADDGLDAPGIKGSEGALPSRNFYPNLWSWDRSN